MSAKQKKQPKILIPVIRVVNPFDPREFVRETFVWKSGKPLSDYLPMGMVEHVVSINGKLVQLEDFAVTYLDQTDNLVLCPVPTGRGDSGGKNVLRMVAMIAVAVFAPYATTALLGINGAAAIGGLGVSMVTAGITIAGGMLVNALLPPPKPTAKSSQVGDSATYGIDGAKNTSAEGLAVPVCYGTFRAAGNIVGLYVQNEGNKQFLYMLINAGEGPVVSLSDLRINDQPASYYKNVEVQTRLGYASQDMIPWFADTSTPRAQSRLLIAGEYKYYTTVSQVDRLRFDVVFPSGMGKANEKTNAVSATTVNLEIEVNKVGTTEWVGVGTTDIGYNPLFHYKTPDSRVEQFDANGRFTNFLDVPGQSFTSYTLPAGYIYSGPGLATAGVPNATDTVYQEVTVSSTVYQDGATTTTTTSYVPVGTFDRERIYQPGVTITESSTVALRRSFYTGTLEQGIYNTRVRRTTPDATSLLIQDKVTLTDINEIVMDDVQYVNTALVGLKIQLDDQLSGIPNVTFINGGRILPTYNFLTNQWESRGTSNPAWIALDVMSNRRYGGAMPYARFDLEMFKTYAKHCEAAGLSFNGVIDSSTNMWDALQPIMRCGHAQIVNVGTRFTVVIERATDVSQMFGMGNIIEGSFKQSWLSLSDRSNEIDVTFFDKEDLYRQRTVRVSDSNAVTRQDAQRPSAITMVGVVDAAQAYREGFFQLNLNRYILQTVEFSAPTESIACTVGDLIYVQHDMPQWGQAGRLEAASTKSVIQLDHTITMIAGKQYKLMLRFDAVVRNEGSIVSITGTTVIANSPLAPGRVKRFSANGNDRAILSTFNPGAGLSGFVLEGAPFQIGAPYKVWDTDVIEERDVVVAAGEQSTVTVMSPYTELPAQFVNWMFGEVTKVKKPFRVKAIKGSHDYKRDLSCVEYNDSVYDLSGAVLPTGNFSELDAGVQHVIIDGVDETMIASGAGFFSQVKVGFHSTQESYSSSIVKVSTNGSSFQIIDPAAKFQAVMKAEAGDVLIFRVIATDAVGAVANEKTAPVIEYTVLGRKAPGAASGLYAVFGREGTTIHWDAPLEPDWEKTTIRVGANWNAGQEIYAERGTSVLLKPEIAPVTRNYMLRNSIPRVNAAVDSSISIAFLAPDKLVFLAALQNMGAVNLIWQNARTIQYLKSYTFRVGGVGDSFESLPDQAEITSESRAHTMVFPTAGTRRVWGYATDIGGIKGLPGFIDVSAVGTLAVDTTPAPTPTGFIATAGITTILVETGNPTFTEGKGYGSTVLYGVVYVSGPLPTFANAKRLTENVSNVFSFPSESGTTWHLWAKWKTKDGFESTVPAGGLNGVVATTGINVELTIDQLEGHLLETQLDQSLRTRINLVDGADFLDLSVNGRISREARIADRAAVKMSENILRDATSILNEVNDRTSAINTEAQTRATALLTEATQRGTAINTLQNLVTTGDSQLASQITTLSAVVNGNVAAIQTEASTRATADSAEAALRVTLASRVDTGLSEALAVIASESLTRSTADTSLASQITTLSASVSGNAAAIQTEASTRATADSAEALARTTLTTQVTTDRTNTTAAFLNEANARTTAIAAEASSRNALATQVTTDRTNTAALVVSESNARSAADTAEATARGTLTTQVNLDRTNTAAAVLSESNARSAADSSMATSLSALMASFNNSIGTTTQAAITAEGTARTTAIGAEATQRGLLAARMTTAEGGLVTTNASIVEERSVRVGAEGAISTRIDGLVTTVNGNTSAISEEITTRVTNDNKLFSQYSVKIDQNGYITGFGLSSTLNNAIPSSTFAVRADSFYIANPTGAAGGIAAEMPFIVRTTPTTINGVNVPVGVFIRDGFIQNGTITNAKIGNAAIDDAKISNLSVSKLISGSVTVSTFIKSSNYVTGTSGWAINGNGQAEYSDVVARGAIFASSGTFTGTISAATINGSTINSASIFSGVIDLSGFNGGWGYLRSAGKWWGDGINGWILARSPTDGTTFVDIQAGTNRIWMSSFNDCGITFPGISMSATGLTITQGSVIGTGQLQLDSSTGTGSNTGIGSATVSLSCLAGRPVFIHAMASGRSGGGVPTLANSIITARVDAVDVKSESVPITTIFTETNGETGAGTYAHIIPQIAVIGQWTAPHAAVFSFSAHSNVGAQITIFAIQTKR